MVFCLLRLADNNQISSHPYKTLKDINQTLNEALVLLIIESDMPPSKAPFVFSTAFFKKFIFLSDRFDENRNLKKDHRKL